MLVLGDFTDLDVTGITLTKEMRELYNKNFWTLTKETIEDTDIERVSIFLH